MKQSQSLVLTGVESTGKTRLAEQLAESLKAPLVPELARSWLSARGGRYEEPDLLELARAQWDAEQTARATAPLVVVDTDLLVLRIWSEIRFGRCDPWISSKLKARPSAFYLLPALDLPWVFDPLRETPEVRAREQLQKRYEKWLATSHHDYALVAGQGEARLRCALQAVKDRFGNEP